MEGSLWVAMLLRVTSRRDSSTAPAGIRRKKRDGWKKKPAGSARNDGVAPSGRGGWRTGSQASAPGTGCCAPTNSTACARLHGTDDVHHAKQKSNGTDRRLAFAGTAKRACGEREEHVRASPDGKQREQAPAFHMRGSIGASFRATDRSGDFGARCFVAEQFGRVGTPAL